MSEGNSENGHLTKTEPVNLDEKKYLDQIRHILENGDKIIDRTGVGTLSVFGMHSSYSLRNGKIKMIQLNLLLQVS